MPSGSSLEHRVAAALQRPQHRDQRRVGQLVVAELDAGAAENPAVEAPRRLDQLSQQPRLADTGLAREEEIDGSSSPTVPAERPLELAELGLDDR